MLTGTPVGPVWFRVLAVCACSVVAAIWFWSNSVVYTDDAFIYFTVARNWAAGIGPVINPGDTHTPVTGLVWAAALRLLASVAPSSLPFTAKGLTCVLVMASGCLLGASLIRRSTAAALAAPFAIASLELLRYTVGLELHLALLVSLLAISLVVRHDRIVAAAAVVGAGFFCRGDVILITPSLFAVWAFYNWRYRLRPPSEIIRRSFLAAALGAFVLTGGLLWVHAVTGSWLPPTFHSKVIQGTVGPWNTFASEWPTHVLDGLGGSWILAPIALLGLIHMGRVGAVLAGFAVVQGAFYSLLHVAHYPWYGWITEVTVRVALSCGVVFSLILIGRVFRLPGRRCEWWQFLAASAALATVAIAPIEKYDLAEHDTLDGVGTASHLIAFLDVAAYIREHHCASDGQPRTVVLTPAVGVLSFYAGCAEYRDVNGLASPGLTAETLNDWQYWVRRYSPKVLVRRRHLERRNPNLVFEGPRPGSSIAYEVVADRIVDDYRISAYSRPRASDNAATELTEPPRTPHD